MTIRKRTAWGSTLLLALFTVLSLRITSGFAQPPLTLSQTPPDETYSNIARINVGVGFYNSGWYSCSYYYPYYACDNGSYTSYIPFVGGVQTDIHLGERSYISPGFQVMTGSATGNYFNGTQQVDYSNHITLWEPSIDYVGKSGTDTDETVGRFRVGGGLYFGSDGHMGGTFRAGGGGSFFNNKRVGLGLDIVFEGGSYHGYWIGGIQLLASPEFHF